MKKYNLYQAYALKIKREIFWHFLFKGILLYKFETIAQDIHGNSFDDKDNYLWWPYKHHYRVISYFKKSKKRFFVSVICEDLNKFDVPEVLKQYRECVVRIKKALNRDR